MLCVYGKISCTTERIKIISFSCLPENREKMKKIREKKSYKNKGNYDVGRFGEYLGWLFMYSSRNKRLVLTTFYCFLSRNINIPCFSYVCMMMRISKKKAKKIQYETTYSIVTKRNIFLQCNTGWLRTLL